MAEQPFDIKEEIANERQDLCDEDKRSGFEDVIANDEGNEKRLKEE